MKIAIGADHGGFELKKILVEFLKNKKHQIDDQGTYSEESCDYPKFSYEVALRVAKGEVERGVLVCKSGIGSSIAANKVPGARAAVCNRAEEAGLSREHNDANIIVFGSKFISPDEAKKALEVFLQTEHAGGRHKRRVDQIKDNEKKIAEGEE